MKKILILFGLTVILCSCQKSKDIKTFNKELIKIVKENSLYSDSLNWPVIEKEIDSISKVKQNVDQSSASVAYLISKLRTIGDNHSHHISKKEFGDMKEQNLCAKRPESKYLGNNIAYIKVPEIFTANVSVMNTYATKIQQLIKALDSNYINGWLIDLRGNTGGGLYPMIAGLGPIIGEGNLGYSIHKNFKTRTWSYQNGIVVENSIKDFYNKNGKKNREIFKSIRTVTVSNPYVIKNRNAKIAVLIDNNTNSAGEFTAISFIGKNNVKLFGSATGGYTTDNDVFILSDGSLLNLATRIVADRNMKKYYGQIIPDVVIYDYMNNGDRSLEEAVKWLKEK